MSDVGVSSPQLHLTPFTSQSRHACVKGSEYGLELVRRQSPSEGSVSPSLMQCASEPPYLEVML